MDDLMFNMDIEEEMTPIGVHRNFNTYHNTIDTYMLPMLRSDSKVIGMEAFTWCLNNFRSFI